MSDSRSLSRKAGLEHVLDSLTARGYSAVKSSKISTPAFQVISPRGPSFWIECRNVNRRGYTWIIGKIDTVHKPHYIMTYAPTETGVDPIEFWIMTFDEILEFVDSYKGTEPQGDRSTFKHHYERWEKLPR